MRFYLDENFPRSAARRLQDSGHQALHALDLLPPGTDDHDLFADAQRERAVFVTTDKDFFHTVPLSFSCHHGSIVISLRRPNREALLGRLEDALTELADRELENSVWLVTDSRIFSRTSNAG